ncbi:MAG: hypothetical protein Q8J69_13630 [Sphingobacteriaceae bacterium]|nr:hypothetical protein [Sphingobacteriaceae bacterium]
MQTVKLKVKEGVYEELLSLLSKFEKDEVEVISEPMDMDFKMNQEHLAVELDDLVKGKAKLIELDEVEQRLEYIIIKHENTF